MSDRKNSILTDADRRLLQNEMGDVTRQARNQQQEDMKERIASGILDFRLIQPQLSDEVRSEIFDPDEYEVFPGIRPMVSFAYQGLLEQGVDQSTIQNIFQTAIQQVEALRDDPYPLRSVDVSIDIDRADYNVDELEKRFDEREPLTDSEIILLWRRDKIDGTEMDEYKNDIRRTSATEVVEEPTDEPD